MTGHQPPCNSTVSRPVVEVRHPPTHSAEPGVVMPETRTYLELSEEGDGAHKYYEVVVDGCDVTVTYGRIGAKGQTGTTTHATPQKAEADGKKKVAAKLRKG